MPAPAATATSATASTAPPSGVPLQLSPPTRGASTTGMTICITRTVGATRVAAKRCSAVDSLTTPTITTEATRAAHATTASNAPSEASWATILATNAAIPSAAPALATSSNIGY